MHIHTRNYHKKIYTLTFLSTYQNPLASVVLPDLQLPQPTEDKELPDELPLSVDYFWTFDLGSQTVEPRESGI